ncbi:hypothetical protein F4778DRAFT_765918 [Xylariomycetidae sp. FL2044]|nr:hypothetical protein F4778DRAFT_765857 [Xylariomycetidae sp. FL2044]KAH9883668.1 hypothetical protein F4778DRAFT_765918 [Xylariomycetidae sp. FL2044]
MNTKSLSNLASYTNPMQKAAQNILSAHRRPASARLSPHLRPSTSDNLRRARFQGEGLAKTRSDPVTLNSLLQSDGTNEHVSHTRHRFPPGLLSNHAEVLSKGPGAPAPLTAGPPGRRQVKPTAPEPFDAPSNQQGLQRYMDFDDNVLTPNPYTYQQDSKASFYPGRQSSLSLQSETWSSVQGTGNTEKNVRVFDTISPEEALYYYPKGLPPNFNQVSQVPDDWHIDYPILPEFRSLRNEEILLKARLAKVREDFYSGAFMLQRPWQVACQDMTKRRLAETIGTEYEEPEKPIDAVEYRKISIEDANMIPSHEHARPLVSMVFQSLANHPEFCKQTKLPRFQEQPSLQVSRW